MFLKVFKNIVEFFERKKNCKIKFHFLFCRTCLFFITSHTLYIDMEKKIKFSDFLNVLTIFNESLDIFDKFVSQKGICAALL